MIGAMKSFPDDDEVQAQASAAIANAFFFPDPAIENAMVRFAHELNGIKQVVSAMKNFPDNAVLQLNCSKILKQMSRQQALRDALKKESALCAVGGAAEKHDGEELQSTANAFFQNMFGNN